MRLVSQMTAALAATTVLVGLSTGEFVRHFEEGRIERQIREQTDQILSLMSGMTVEAIIVEDAPLVETAINQAMQHLPSLLEISVKNEDSELIAQIQRSNTNGNLHSLRHQKKVVFEGESFGRIDVRWSTEATQAQVDASVNAARLYTMGGLLLLSVLIGLFNARLVLRPLNIIHHRLRATHNHTRTDRQELPATSATELAALAQSVDELSVMLDERNQREAELQHARDKAEAANRAKSQFLATMSHEIRTPMNGVLGMSELLLESDLDPDQRLYAETIANSGTALLTVINDILDFSKIEAGKMVLDEAAFNLQKTIEDVIMLLSSKATEKNVELICRYDPALPVAFIGDKSRFRQIITNLLGNAVKFTLQGQVIVEVTAGDDDTSSVLKISVTDTGIGIAPQDLPRVFGVFEQVDGSVNRKFEGTGLGLAITKRLTELMGGTITVTSRLAEGTCFTLQVCLQPAETAPSDDDVRDLDLQGKRVLVVDDLEVNRTILKERLSAWGMSAVCVADGPTALATLEKQAHQPKGFDLAIIDYQMPGMEGTILAERMKELHLEPALPVILLSSSDAMLNPEQRMELGIAKCLFKPARASALFNAIVSSLYAAITPGGFVQDDVAPRTARPPSGRPIHILVAEDNQTNQLLIKSMLNNLNAKPSFTENGRLALETYKSTGADLVLMDLSMPEMNGFEATGAIRAHEDMHGLPHCPIVALTANAMPEDRQRCLDAGMDDYLTKPISKPELIATIDRWNSTQCSCRPVGPVRSAEANPVATIRIKPGAATACQAATPGTATPCHSSQPVQSVCRREPKVAVVPDPLSATTPQTYERQDQNIAHDPIIDHDRVSEMVEDFGAEVFDEIVSSFAKEVATALQALNTALTAKDIEEIRKLLHLIEGCASNVGAIGLCELCDEIRTQVTAGNMPTAQDPFSALHAETCHILKQQAAA